MPLYQIGPAKTASLRMEDTNAKALTTLDRLGSIAMEASELPVLRMLSRPIRRKLFQRPYRDGNDYYGVHETFAAAQAAAQALSTRSLPATYDTDAAGRMYRAHLKSIRVSDYPLVYWLARLFAAGQRRLFDLGGHIGVSYYGFHPYLDYPPDLAWTVHDVPAVMAAGRKWASEHDSAQQLAFATSAEDADGQDILMSTGALQYLDYTLPELLQRLQTRPRHVLVNLTPMHPTRSFFTLQNLSIAICPYRVMSVPDFTAGMEALGYRMLDHWQSFERGLRVPFEPECTVDSYHGFHFSLPAAHGPAA